MTEIGLTQGVPETGFFRESVGENEVFSSKNPVSLVGCVSPKRLNLAITFYSTKSRDRATFLTSFSLPQESDPNLPKT